MTPPSLNRSTMRERISYLRRIGWHQVPDVSPDGLEAQQAVAEFVEFLTIELASGAVRRSGDTGPLREVASTMLIPILEECLDPDCTDDVEHFEERVRDVFDDVRRIIACV